MFVPNREELAWAAGFFDGEGSTSFAPNLVGHRLIRWKTKKYGERVRSGTRQYPTIRLSISQAGTGARELLARFQRAVAGLGTVNGPYRYRGHKEHWKSTWHYSTSGHRATQAVIAMLWPFLGSVKKDQTRTAFERWNHRESA